MRRQIKEMLAIRLALVNRGELEEADAQNAKMEPLWTHLWTEMEADIKARQDKLDADLEKKKADMKAFNEMMEKKEAGSHSRQDSRQPDEIGTRNRTSRKDGCLDSGHEG
jgi:hypothetical protein